ncbi:MAG: hypothetical protein H0U74_09705 [Bradymonadaceae bacterium]|nr:hypothetical protein [Lujinxingiaceae bacterium]
MIAAIVTLGLVFSASMAWAQNNSVNIEVESEEAQQRTEPQYEEPVPETRAETRREVVVPEERVRVEQVPPPNYIGVLTRSAFLGGILGGLVGLGGYLISGRTWDPWNIAYFAGGGILVGTAVGLIEIVARDDRAQGSRASLEYLERDMPRTLDVRIFNLDF